MQFPFSLSQNKEFDVIGFGTNAVDYLIQVPEYPAFNSKIELTDHTQAAGGEVATAMAGLLYGLVTGSSVEESARMANAVAALKCRAIGARTSLPEKGELYDFLNGK